jgi:hypothetical protein
MNMDIQQMLAHLLAEMRSSQEKMDANDEKMMTEIQAETEAIRARMKAMRDKRMEANINACQKDMTERIQR